MFKPKFNYTHNIVNNLIKVTSAKEIILNAYFVPRWKISSRREALIRATPASPAIGATPLHLKR